MDLQAIAVHQAIAVIVVQEFQAIQDTQEVV